MKQPTMNIRSISIAALSILAHDSVVAQANAGPDQYICGNSTSLLANTLAMGETGFWDGGASGAVFVDAADPFTEVGNLPYGVTELTWVHIAPTGASSDVVAVWAYDEAMPFADAGPDQVIVAPPNFGYLSASTPVTPAVCYWTVVSGACTIMDPTLPNTMVTDIGIGWTVLTWTCDNGPCGVSADQVTLQMMLSTGIEIAASGQPNPFVYNPATRDLHVLNGTTVNAIDVFDSRGRCISRTDVGIRSINMNDRPKGIYVARAIVDDRSVVQRFVVGY
jgi:hypothetical protein